MTTLFIGVGRMGTPMVRRYAAAHQTILYDASPSAARLGTELGVPVLQDLGKIPEEIDVVMLMVPNSSIVEDILIGTGDLLNKLPQGSLVIDMSSSVPASTQELGQRALQLNIDFVDAPVSGGVAKAESGELAVMVGGSDAGVSRALPHIEPMSGPIQMVGPSGSGHAAKALNNLLSATNIIAASEILAISTRFGIDPQVMISVINHSTGRSQASEVKFPRHILTGSYDSGFGMDLMLKDLGIARSLADENELATPLTALARSIAQDARDRIGAMLPDHTELARHVEVVTNSWFDGSHDLLVNVRSAEQTSSMPSDD